MVTKTSGAFSLQDEDSGEKARVEANTTGDQALHVIAEIGSFTSPTAGVPVFDGTKYTVDFSRTDISLSGSGTGTQIYQYTGGGILEAFLLHLEDKNTDILLFIDGVERYDIDCRVFEDMGYEFKDGGDYPTYYNKDLKIFKHSGKFPIKFNTSFEIRARSSGKKVKGYVVNYFED